MARLLLSVAPLVKMISLPPAPISSAICSRALLDGLLGLPAEGVVAAGGVAELLGEVRQHRLDHARVAPRRGVVVQVDRQFHAHKVHIRSQTPKVNSSGLTDRGWKSSARVTPRSTA